MASSNAEKADRVREYATRHGSSLDDCLAFGDRCPNARSCKNRICLISVWVMLRLDSSHQDLS